MKKLIIIIMLLLSLTTVSATQDITTTNPPLKNERVGDSFIINFETPFEYDYGNTTGLTKFEEGKAITGYEYLCWDDGEEASLNSCWGGTSSAVVSGETGFQSPNAIKLNGGAYDFRFDNSGITNITVEAFVATNISPNTPERTPGIMFRYEVAGGTDLEFYMSNILNNITFDLDPVDTRTQQRLTYTRAGSQTSENWTYIKMDGESENYFGIGNNWSNSANGTEIDTARNYVSQVKMGAGSDTVIMYYDRIRIYNQSPTHNASKSIHAFKRMHFDNSFNFVNYFYYGGDSELLFSCDNSTPTNKVTVNDTGGLCPNSQSSQDLVVWINITSDRGNVTYANITTSNANSLNLTIFDEITQAKITSLVELSLVGDTFSQNYTTTDGNISFENLPTQEYRITYSSNLYKQRDYFFTLNERTHNNIDLYLLTLSNSTDVTITVQDESADFLENAEVHLKRYYVDSNSYVIVAMGETDFEGTTILDVDFDDAYYQLFASFGNSSVNTVGSRIFSTTIILTISTLADAFANIDEINKIVSNISYNNDTATYSYFFSDTDGLTRNAKIEVVKLGTGEVVCVNTIESSSATLLCEHNLTESDTTIVASGYVNNLDGDIDVLMVSIEQIAGVRKDIKELFGMSGVFYAVLFAGSVAGLGVFSVAASVLLFIAALTGMIIMGLSIMNTALFIVIVLIGFLVIWRVKT